MWHVFALLLHVFQGLAHVCMRVSQCGIVTLALWIAVVSVHDRKIPKEITDWLIIISAAVILIYLY